MAVAAMAEVGIDAARPIRDEIERRVRALLDQLGVETQG